MGVNKLLLDYDNDFLSIFQEFSFASNTKLTLSLGLSDEILASTGDPKCPKDFSLAATPQITLPSASIHRQPDGVIERCELPRRIDRTEFPNSSRIASRTP
ncbi:MAG: hypothetical protein ACR9NN_05995 [Nostochopsis sp.]